MRAPAVAALLLAVPALAAGCGGSSSSSQTTTPEAVCTQLTNIAGTVKNLSAGIASGEASLDAITWTTQQLKQELAQLNEAAAGIDDPNVPALLDSFTQFRRAYLGLEPGTTPKQAQAALQEPAAQVKASWKALADSLACPTPAA